ncbi:hypothetical protein [uncultured Clostridium sp.]|uniref:hypothetical protein n=1 Tax=uncultured Clostridium sp. TaxID=59620 RepID=UPI00262626BE|nr:hypothetical protein [uncultured Clostridium sp.]
MGIKFEFDKIENKATQATEPSQMDKILDKLSSLSIADIKAIQDQAQMLLAISLESCIDDEIEKWQEIYSTVEDHLNFRIEQIFE